MTPDRFVAILEMLWWSQHRFALMVRQDHRVIRRWAAGDEDVPEPLASWLEGMARHVQANPLPVRMT